MNRLLISLIVFAVCQAPVSAQYAPEHSITEIVGMPPLTIEDFGLKGSVKTVHQRSYRTMWGKEQSSGEVTMEFDGYGKIIKDQTLLTYNGMRMGNLERTYTYNDKGKITEMKWRDLDLPNELPEYNYFTYNAKGQLTFNQFSSPKGITSKEEWIYNTNGMLTGWQETRGSENKPFHTKQFTFDAKNRITKVISILTTEENGTDSTIYTYSYTDGILLPTGYDVSTPGDPNSSYEQLGKETRTYNASNDHIRSTWATEPNNPEQITYKYDSDGNWTDKRSSFVTAERHERTITYFTELTPHIYRKTIAEAMMPSINNFGAFAQAVQMQSKNSTELIQMVNTMQLAAIEDVKKLQALGDLKDNAARSHAIQYLTVLGSAETRIILRDIANAPQNLDPLRSLGMTLNGHRNNMSTELNKLF